MEAEARLLAEHGHIVMKYERTNAEIEDAGIMIRAKSAFNVAWSKTAYDAIDSILQEFKPDIMHVHNYWLLLTPSIFAAAKLRGVATVLTLHNYRLVCPGTQFLRNNEPCELCLDGKPWRVLLHRCYPGRSLLKSVLSLRLFLDTRKKQFLSPWVDGYIALSDFGREKFIEGGLPGEKIHVKPNFIDDPYKQDEIPSSGRGAVVIGRISQEKGLDTVAKAWQRLNYPLTIVGDGPLRKSVEQKMPASVRFTGQKPHDETMQICKQSPIFIFPSECYEGSPLSLLEAMALGRAIIATDLGQRREIIRDGVSGILYQAGNAEDLRRKIVQLIENPDLCKSLGNAARHTYLERYVPEKNYEMLMNIYQRVLGYTGERKN